MIVLLCDDELYLVEKTPELIQKHLKEVGTRPTEVVPETHTQEWKDYNLKYWPATAALEEMIAELEPTPMPYNDHAMGMIVRIVFGW